MIIFTSQISELLGLRLAVKEPGALVDKVPVLIEALPTLSTSAAAVAALTVATILVLRKFRPTWPGMLIAVCLASAVTALLHLDV